MRISGGCGRELSGLQGGLPGRDWAALGVEQLQQARPVASDDAAAGV